MRKAEAGGVGKEQLGLCSMIVRGGTLGNGVLQVSCGMNGLFISKG